MSTHANGTLINAGDQVLIGPFQTVDVATLITLSGTYTGGGSIIFRASSDGGNTFSAVQVMRLDTGVSVSSITLTQNQGVALQFMSQGWNWLDVQSTTAQGGTVSVSMNCYPSAVPGSLIISDSNAALERFRIRVGLSLLLEGMGVSLGDLTAADMAQSQ